MIRRTIIVVLTLAAVGMGVLSLVLFTRPDPVQGVAGMSSGGADYDWRWGRSGSYVVFTRVGRPDEVGAGPFVDRPGFALIKGGNMIYLHVSIWVPLAITTLLATYPTIVFIHGSLRRRRRRRKGLCAQCGYNLTGNVSGVCPECGSETRQPWKAQGAGVGGSAF